MKCTFVYLCTLVYSCFDLLTLTLMWLYPRVLNVLTRCRGTRVYFCLDPIVLANRPSLLSFYCHSFSWDWTPHLHLSLPPSLQQLPPSCSTCVTATRVASGPLQLLVLLSGTGVSGDLQVIDCGHMQTSCPMGSSLLLLLHWHVTSPIYVVGITRDGRPGTLNIPVPPAIHVTSESTLILRSSPWRRPARRNRRRQT